MTVPVSFQGAALVRDLKRTISGADANDDEDKKDTEPTEEISPEEKARATFPDNLRAQELDIKVRSGKKLTFMERKKLMGYLGLVVSEMWGIKNNKKTKIAKKAS